MRQLQGAGCTQYHWVSGVSGEGMKKKAEGVCDDLELWRQIDASITDAVNEAGDNLKFLRTLDKFDPVVYGPEPAAVIKVLSALVGALKMIHTVSSNFSVKLRTTTSLRRPLSLDCSSGEAYLRERAV